MWLTSIGNKTISPTLNNSDKRNEKPGTFENTNNDKGPNE